MVSIVVLRSISDLKTRIKRRKLLEAGFKDVEEIEYFGLLDKSEEEIATYIPERFAWFTLRTAVNSSLREVLNDKWITQLYMDALGLRMPKLIGLWDTRIGMRSDGQPFRTPEQFAEAVRPAIKKDGHIDLFFKMQSGRQGSNAFAVRLTASDDKIEASVAGLPPRPLDRFLAELPVGGLSYFETTVQGWIVQERVRQHPVLNSMNGAALNGARFLSYLELPVEGQPAEATPCVEYAHLKVGRTGSETDYVADGSGLTAGIDLETGRLKSHARFFQEGGGEYAEVHPDSGVRFDDIELPFWQEAKDLCSRAAMAFPSIRIIAWDIAFAEDGPTIVEANGGWNQKSIQCLGQGFLTPERRVRFERGGIPLPPKELPSTASVISGRLKHRLSRLIPGK